MSIATTHLLEAFERLSPAEQREFSAVIASRATPTVQADTRNTPAYGEPADDELTAAAARIFTMLDDEEASHNAPAR